MTKQRRSRAIEDGLAILGGLTVFLYVVGGIVFPIFWASYHCLGEPPRTHFSWDIFAFSALCIAPKTLGRMTAGRVWTRVPEVIISWFTSRKPPDGDGTAG